MTCCARHFVRVVVAGVLVSGASAQIVLHVHHGEADAGRFGSSLAGGGDLDGDGVDDTVVGAPLERVAGASVGVVRAYSGSDGRLLLRVEGTQLDGDFGRAVAILRDVDGDGRDDIVVGIPGSDRVEIRSGADGALLSAASSIPGSTFGRSLANAGDTDGDGVHDVVVGGPLEGFGGLNVSRVSIVSGATGSIIAQFLGTQPSDNFGAAVGAVGDLDGDGRPDVVVGAPGDDTNGPRAGRVEVLSSATGLVLYSFLGAAAGDELGCSVSAEADLDGDGTGDIVAGAWGVDTGGIMAGAAYAWSGATGAALASLFGAAPLDLFGFAVAAIADIDGDGRGDLLVGAPGDDAGGSGAGRAEVFSGASGASLAVVSGGAAGELTGYAVAASGMVLGIGTEPFLVGAPGAQLVGNQVGRVTQVLALGGQLGTNYCYNAPNSTGQMGRVTATGSPLVAHNAVVVRAYFLPPGSYGYFIVSSIAASIPGLPGPKLCLGGPNIGRFVNYIGQGPVISHPVDLTAIPGNPPSVVQPGDTWHFQCWYRDGGPGFTTTNMTDGLAITFQ
jgi:hypothetical protein